MKNILILGICILIIGCCETSKRTYTVAGTLKDEEVKIAKLKTSDSTFIDSLKNGLFKFIVPALNEEYLVLKIGKRIPMYVKPGDSMFIDYENLDIMNFSGRGFEESQFLHEKRQLIKAMGIDDPRLIDRDLLSSEPEIYLQKIDSIKEIRINHLNDYRKSKPNISNSFCDTESQLINYYWVNQQFLYPRFYEMLTGNKPVLSDNYYNFTEQIETNNKALFSFRAYKSALSSYLDFKSKTFNDKYAIAKELFSDSAIHDEIMFREFYRYMSFNGIDNIDSICKEFIESLSDEERKERLLGKYQAWSKLAKGKKAPDFEIRDEKGNLVRLSDLQGKFVYIDCWSSYCGPCIAEMPAMKKLSEDLKGNNIVFISISADKDIERWLGKLKEYNMNTTNLCTEGARHKFNKDYNARAFPRYILIDDKGIIIDATANKPSMIKEELEQLL